MNVRFKFCDQLARIPWKQSVANQIDKPQLQDLFITPNNISIGDEQSKPIFIGRSAKQETTRKSKWSIRRRIWVAYLKIQCKPIHINRTKRRNIKAWGRGAKNTIEIDTWRRKILRKWGWKIFWVMSRSHCWFLASNGRRVTIICPKPWEHTQLKTANKNVSNHYTKMHPNSLWVSLDFGWIWTFLRWWK